ncbi:MAG: nucleotide exchange factor GrpE [Pirellulales bacterium]|nr:nucleotide exchange factor GrpE [Pirellulales bacterium]
MTNSPSMKDDKPAENDLPADTELDQGIASAEQFAEAVQEAVDEAGAIAAELSAEKDRVLRLQAEMENLRNRTSREIADERRYASLSVIRDLLPVIDNIDRALEAAEQNSEAASLLEGFQLVRQQLMSVLEQHHCKRIEDVGQPFDPQFHEAILQQPSDEQPANHIMLVTEVGYRLHDRVVRPSKVIISSGPAVTEEKIEDVTEQE